MYVIYRISDDESVNRFRPPFDLFFGLHLHGWRWRIERDFAAYQNN